MDKEGSKGFVLMGRNWLKMNSKVNITLFKICFFTLVLFQSCYSFAQDDSIVNNSTFIFPEWELGDKKYLKSKTIETSIIDGDTTISESIVNNIFIIEDKTDQHFIVSLNHLDSNDGIASELMIGSENNSLLDDDMYQKIFEYVVDEIFGLRGNSKLIKYKVDKWGYYAGLFEFSQLDSFNVVLGNILMEKGDFSKEEGLIIQEIVDEIDSEEIQSILSETFYNQIRNLLEPYDKELSIGNIKSDTILYLIPWFNKPLSCVQTTSAEFDDSEIKIRIAYEYLVGEDDYLNAAVPEYLDFFALKLSSNYVLDAESKWIKRINSSSERTENSNIYIESNESILSDANQ